MLRIVWNNGVMLNPMLVKMSFKLIRITFPSIISMKSSNMTLFFIFNPYMKFFKCFKCLRLMFQQINPTHTCVIINKSNNIFITKCRCNRHGATKMKLYQLFLCTWSQNCIMKSLLAMFTKDICITLLQIPWNCRKTRNTILLQHIKIIIIDVIKYSMPQDIGWQCTFIMVREVCKIICLCRCSFHL